MAKKRKSGSDEAEVVSAEEYERSAPGRYVLRLYVTGLTPRSQRAIANVRELCEQHLDGPYDLEVIDVYQQPELAKQEQLIAAPTLVKKLPLPLRKLLGDMADPGRVLLALGVKVKTQGG